MKKDDDLLFMANQNSDDIDKKRNWNIRTIRTILSNLVSIFLILFIIFLVFTIVSNRDRNGIKVGSYSLIVIVSGSMEPTIPIGSMVVSKEVSKLDIGDIITYRVTENVSDVFVTHRIVDIADGDLRFITKGDANTTEDGGFVAFDDIIGRVVLTVPHLGLLAVNLKTPQGIVTSIAIFLFIFFVYKFISTFFRK